MIAFPDTSFLCAFYRRQSNSPIAAAHAATMKEPLHVTALLVYEFRQSLRFQVWRHSHNPRQGMPLADAQAALNQLETDLANGVAVLAPCHFQEVFRRAEALSARHTISEGHRSFDILHVATALHLGAREFLTFDVNQRTLAAAEQLKVNPV
ncbi:MAG TPA: type II toxin-antitoxin system VapC family toxin [Verrucomicrobiota bacterium]|jgi:predicted nucleic acid-binding protein|nr:type II toxin-antitoxin system VapC family toxin [Verrucomicrobiota bacterium]